MSRRLTLWLCALAIVVVAIAPLSCLLIYSYYTSVADAEREMTFLSRATAKRTSHILRVVRQNLQLLARESEGKLTQATIDRMNETVFRVLYIREMGLIINGDLVCTDQGAFKPPVSLSERYRTPPPAGHLDLLEPVLTLRGSRSVIVRLGIDSRTYVNALIDPEVFCEFHDFLGIGEESGVMLLRPDGGPLISLGQLSHEHLPAELAMHQHVHYHQGRCLAIAPAENFPVVVVVAASNTYLLRRWREKFVLSVVAGGLCSLLGVGLMVRLVRRQSPVSHLREAIRARQLELHYQPIIDLSSGRANGAEALVRWRHPEQGMVSPGQFIPLAESSGLIIPLTEWVIQQAAHELGPLLIRRPDFVLSINISARHLTEGDLIGTITRAFGQLGTFGQLTIELTETGLADDKCGSRVFGTLRELGVRVAVDDFGTGYSNLRYLQQFPVECLKIDKAFIDGILTADESSGLVDVVLTIGKALGLDMVAEGVERAEQAEYLRKRQVTRAQGWLYSRALPAGELAAFLEVTLAS